ncbi:MAG: hypothetical protein ACOCRX_06280 [Candidatus Woesearchaeota archaeon]
MRKIKHLEKKKKEIEKFLQEKMNELPEECEEILEDANERIKEGFQNLITNSDRSFRVDISSFKTELALDSYFKSDPRRAFDFIEEYIGKLNCNYIDIKYVSFDSIGELPLFIDLDGGIQIGEGENTSVKFTYEDSRGRHKIVLPSFYIFISSMNPLNNSIREKLGLPLL